MWPFSSASVDELKAARNVRGLARRMRDDNWAVRRQAVNALIELATPGAKAVPALMRALRDPELREHQAKIARALEKVGDPRAAEAVASALREVEARTCKGCGWEHPNCRCSDDAYRYGTGSH